MRNHQLALASGPYCGTEISADFLEIRRIEGTGDFVDQEASWQERLILRLDTTLLQFVGEDPTEEFVLDEDSP